MGWFVIVRQGREVYLYGPFDTDGSAREWIRATGLYDSFPDDVIVKRAIIPR